MNNKFFGLLIGFSIGLIFFGDLPAIVLLSLLGLVLFDIKSAHKIKATPPCEAEILFTTDAGCGIFLYINNIVQIGVALLNLKGNIIFSELTLMKTFLVNDMQIDDKDISEVNAIIEQTIQNKENININNATRLINQYCKYEDKLNIIHMLFVIAIADQAISSDELSFIVTIAQNLNIQSEHFEELKKVYYIKEIDPYKILGISTDASISEIKKAYRKLAMQYHPDKLTDETDDAVKQEKIEKFHQIVAAYKKALSEAEE